LARSSSASLRRKAMPPRSLARLDQKRSDNKVSTTRGSGRVKFQRSETARSQKSDTARARKSQTARLQKSEIARRRDTQQTRVRTASGSDPIAKPEPKLTAMLKTTWRVLKKPFKF
jgi:hypothetical protein